MAPMPVTVRRRKSPSLHGVLLVADRIRLRGGRGVQLCFTKEKSRASGDARPSCLLLYWGCCFGGQEAAGGVAHVAAGGGTLGVVVFVPAGASFAFALTVDFPLASVS